MKFIYSGECERFFSASFVMTLRNDLLYPLNLIGKCMLLLSNSEITTTNNVVVTTIFSVIDVTKLHK